MKQIHVRSYRAGDLEDLGYREVVWGTEDALMAGDSYTGVAEDGHLVFCAGATIYWPGHAEVWVHLCHDVAKYIGTWKACKNLLQHIIEKNDLYRVSAHTRADREQDQRFVRHLGFELEGLSLAWGPDKEDYYQWGLLPVERRYLWQ